MVLVGGLHGSAFVLPLTIRVLEGFPLVDTPSFGVRFLLSRPKSSAISAACPPPVAVDNVPSGERDPSAATAVTNVSELHHNILLPLPDPILSFNNEQVKGEDNDSGGNSLNNEQVECDDDDSRGVSLNQEQVEEDDGDSGEGLTPPAFKRRKRESLGATVHYPNETGIRFDPTRMGGRYATIESHDQMRRGCQDAWSGVEPNLIERLTSDARDITLDFRSMLAATGEELNASHAPYLLPKLAQTIAHG